MDPVALVSAMMAAQMAQLQYAIAAKVMQSSPDGPQNALQILNAADGNAGQLANAARGIGQNIDISA
jgi:hypothetical protein